MKSGYILFSHDGLRKGDWFKAAYRGDLESHFKVDEGKENKIEIKVYNWTLLYSAPVDINEGAT